MESPRDIIGPQDLAAHNRWRVVDLLRGHGPLSRSAIARQARVARATITGIVNSLISDGYVEELSERAQNSTGGRPPTLIWFAEGAGQTLALSIQPEAIEWAVVNARGETWPMGRTSLDGLPTQARLTHLITGAVRDASASFPALSGIGLAVPGQVDSGTRTVVQSALMPVLEGSWLGATLDRASHLSSTVVNDVAAEALGEYWFGADPEMRDFVVIHVSQGIGGCAVVATTPVTIQELELGHTTVDPNGQPCPCGKIGCWETMASLTWLTAEAVRRGLPAAAVLPRILLGESNADAALSALRSEWIERLAIGIANTVHMRAEGFIVLTGELAVASESFLEELREKTRARCLKHLQARVRFRLASGQEQSLLMGAAASALTDFFPARGPKRPRSPAELGQG